MKTTTAIALIITTMASWVQAPAGSGREAEKRKITEVVSADSRNKRPFGRPSAWGPSGSCGRPVSKLPRWGFYVNLQNLPPALRAIRVG